MTELLNKETHQVNVAEWKASIPKGIPARDGYHKARFRWKLRTSGSGDLDRTVMYALRAHMRGRVHCHDHTYEDQAKFLESVLPCIEHLVVPRQETTTHAQVHEARV